MFNSANLKQDFPILSRSVRGGKRLVYLDSAATSQKPRQVIAAITDYYEHHNANVHRGIHALGDESTRMFAESHRTISRFFGADDEELVLVRNTTEALNTIVYSWAEGNIGAGGAILCTEMEHHSNLVPWQQVAKRTGCLIKYVSVLPDGQLDMNDFKSKLTSNVKLVAVSHVSNAVGTINPVTEIGELAHNVGAVVVVDGAQSAPHLPIDFHALGCDFFAFSGHKMLGPMGIGGLLVRKDRFKEMKPALFGGGMISEVRLEETTFAELPDRFIAGTPDVASTVGLAVACDYLSKLGMNNVAKWDSELIQYALKKLSEVPQLTIVGPTGPTTRCGSVTFLYKDVHAHDVAQVLDSEGVAVRSGHHCTMPLHSAFHWAATTRASFNVYTTKEDIDALVVALHKVKQVFGK